MENKIKTILPALLLSFLLAGCGSSGNTSSSNSNGLPAWVDNPGSSFDQNQYLMAVGSGSTLNEARSDAFASLSQIFQMNVNASEELYSETTDSNINNQLYSEHTSQLINNIKIGTNQDLINSTILTSEVDGMGTYYALAGMERSETARIYNQEISNNRLKIDEFESNADNENNVLQKLILYKKAKALASANEVLTRQLSIIRGGAASGGLSTETLARIDEKFRATQQNANVYIDSDNGTETVKSAVASALQKVGFNVAGDDNDAILSVNVNYSTQKAELNRDNAEFVKWELVIDVADIQTNRSFNTFIVEGRDGALSYEDALKRADFAARSKIEKDFHNFLTKELLATN